MALLDREVISSQPGTREFELAAERVWIEVTMNDPEQRELWEEAAKQAKTALTSERVSAEELLNSHGLPSHKAEYQAWAAEAVEQFLARDATHQAATNAARAINQRQTSESAAAAPPAREREMASAINFRDLAPQHFVGVEPSIREVDVSSVRSASPVPEYSDAAAVARRYLDLNMTPPRGSERSSICSIASSLGSDLDSVAEIVTAESGAGPGKNCEFVRLSYQD
jgi:hypothetical protein